MTRLNAQQAIEGPCKFAGIGVEENFSTQLLDRLSPEGAEIELTYLQVYLDKIYRTAIASEEIAKQKTVGIIFTNDILEKLGDVKDLLGSFLEEQIAELPDPDTALVVLKAFVSTKGTKRQVTTEEVLDYSRTLGKNIPLEQLQELIHLFVSLRILRDKDESGRYELRHDALAAKIFEKITVFEKDLLEIRQFIENAYANYQKRGLLLSVSDLRYIKQYEDKIFLDKNLLYFVDKSKLEFIKRQKALNRVTALSTFFFLVIISLFVIYFVKQQEIRDNKDAILNLFFKSENNVQDFFNARILYDERNTSIAIAAGFNAFYKLKDSTENATGKNPFDKIYKFNTVESNILFADFSFDGKVIYGYTADSSIFLWNTNGNEQISIKLSEIPLLIKL